MGLKIKMELQARWAAEAKAMAIKSELGDNSSNFFLTAVRHSVSYSAEPDPYMDPPQLPLTSALIQVCSTHPCPPLPTLAHLVLTLKIWRFGVAKSKASYTGARNLF